MTQSSRTLNGILTKIREIHLVPGAQCLVVFDLDSTLFDVGPRIQQILHDFAHHEGFQKRFPEPVKMLKKAETQRADWGIKQAVLRAGLEHASEEFHDALKNFWIEKFFSNAYLHFDVPYDGAVEFVQSLDQLGAEIVYLTGRDIYRMGVGSAEVLHKWKFPLNGPKSRLVLKPDKGLNDAAFKSNWFAELPTEKYAKIWFFENEPVNINQVLLDHQHVEIVFFESTHSGKAPAPTDLPTIMHFLLNK